MALDRQRIERKDFPIGRRGYDPDAVDAHLAAVADEVEELKRGARRRSETLAAAASEQVQAIVEAAENSAAVIQRQAEEEAQEIRAEAASEARSTRDEATEQAREYVGSVSDSTNQMLQRLEAMESELGALIEALKTGGNRLTADLRLLENNLGEVRGTVVPRPRFSPEPPGAERSESLEPEDESAKRQGDALGEATDAPAAEVPIAPEGEAGDSGEGAGDDDDGARLVALNMALNGTPREETDRYLSENFTLRDQAGLLDEVYSSVGG